MQQINRKLALLALAIILCTLPALAQFNDDDPGGDPGIPIDGGLALLLAAGVAYGGKKAAQYHKQRKLQDTNEIEK